MCLDIARDGFWTVGGITVSATVAAAVVGSDVNADHTAALRPLILVFFNSQPGSGELLEQNVVNAMTVGGARGVTRLPVAVVRQ